MTRSHRTRHDARWERHAANYDARTAWLERRLLADGRRWVCGRARGRTLELAVGTAANLPYYPRDVRLTAVDRSAAMIAHATSRADREGWHVDLRVADAASLSFADATFDSVLCTYALCGVDDVAAVLREARRVMRPGGRLLLADHVGSTWWPLRVAQHVVEWATVPVAGEHLTRRPRAALETHGFEVVAATRIHRGVIECVHATRMT